MKAFTSPPVPKGERQPADLRRHQCHLVVVEFLPQRQLSGRSLVEASGDYRATYAGHPDRLVQCGIRAAQLDHPIRTASLGTFPYRESKIIIGRRQRGSTELLGDAQPMATVSM